MWLLWVEFESFLISCTSSNLSRDYRGKVHALHVVLRVKLYALATIHSISYLCTTDKQPSPTMSSVFYRWGARKDESRITFDGTHISVFDLKREIILSNKMGNGKDFDIGVFDNVTGEGQSFFISFKNMELTIRVQR